MAKPSPEDLIDVVIAADALKRKARNQPPARYRPSQRVWVEPVLNVLGDMWGRLMYLLPWAIRKPYVQWVMRKMSGRPPEINPGVEQCIRQTLELAKSVRQETGQWPALLVVMSHPQTEGPLEWIRFEAMRQGILVADAYLETIQPHRLFRTHPKLLLAIDPFALDTVSAPVAGFYGGWMRRIYLAYDRQPSTQSWIQKRVFLRYSHFAHIGWKLLRHLRSDIPVLMAFGGGLPTNARLLYAAREFVQRLTPQKWKVTKRAAQIELMRLLMQQVNGVWPPESGEIPVSVQSQIEKQMLTWGLTPEESRDSLQHLVEEFRLPVPYRERLLRVLRSRLVNRGKPLILLPVSHAATPPHVRLAQPIVLKQGVWDFRPFSKSFANIFA